MKKNKMLKIAMIVTIMFSIIWLKNSVCFAGTLSSDINKIDENKYPGVKSLIQNLQNKHNNYHFQVYYTGIDWTEAVTMEYQGHGSSPKNLFGQSSKYTGKWFCPICGKKSYDTGWHCASIDAIKYMMDPRNSLDETSVYQFKNLENADVSSENIQNVINNKYANYNYINNQTAINAIVKASSDYSMNGFSILAKIINEQGKGTSPLATGSGYNGQYVGYYNFFNVGAYGNGYETVMLNGLKYASNKGWNSVEKSILGGSEYYKSQYIGRGQNTLYYQRFNVVYKTSLFSHQYQQDIMGAQTSGTLLKTYYTLASTIDSVEHNFIIPLYENMPKAVSARPSTSENQNLNLEESTVLTNKLAVRAAPNSGQIISYLNVNEKIKVLQRATSTSSDGNYWDTIVSNRDGTYGYVLRSGISQSVDAPSYAFDSKYYADTYPDLKSAFGYNDVKLYKHFITSGIFEGRSSSPVLNVKYYVENNSDLKAYFKTDYVSAFYHFINSGCNERRMSSPNYDGTFYKYHYSDLTNLKSKQLIEHYINFGRKEGRIGGIDQTIMTIVFDADIYARLNSDLKASFGNNQSALKQHWITYGIREGRTASLVYYPSMYRQLNTDLNSAFGNNYESLFAHFIYSGINEARKTSLVFAPHRYLAYNADIKAVYGNNYKEVYIHYLKNGINEGRVASDIFSVTDYLNENEDLKNAFGNNYKEAIIHFLTSGCKELRKTSNSFDLKTYIENYEDLRNLLGKDYKKYYIHYLKIGKSEGRIGI